MLQLKPRLAEIVSVSGGRSMKQILVVEDMPEIRFVYTRLLTGPEVNVLEAEDGVDALEILKKAEVDLVLTDCQMPNMTGVELMQVAQKEYPDLPFIVISSNFQDEDMEDLKPLAVFSKPFRLDELREAVGKALED